VDRRRLLLALGSIALMLVTALVTYLYATGSPAVLEPGGRSTAHAGIDCTRCHDQYRGTPDGKCLDCHADAANQTWHTLSGGGVDCTKCHYEHAGRDRLTDLTVVPACPRGPNLTGAHDGLRCVECHRTGEATEDCAACHEMYIGGTHLVGYVTDCKLCHDQDTWVTSFDHAKGVGQGSGTGALPCSDCHAADPPHALPAYTTWSADCAACHATDRWVLPAFPHDDVKEPCEQCHPASLDAKWGRTSGSCTDCHTVLSWTPPAVDHLRLDTDCTRCHEGDQLATHLTAAELGGQDCDACHLTSSWSRSIDHATYPGTCTQCHVEDRSAHGFAYATDCQWCHGTDHWQVTATHPAADADCISCHPDPHAGGDAVAHVDAEHSALCGACHVGGTNWTIMDVDHALLGDDCAACHVDPHGAIGPSSANCAMCHGTDAWVPLVADHAQMGTDCRSCHESPHPNAWDRWSEQCELCHNTVDFGVRSYDHAVSNVTGVPCVNCHDDVHKGTLGLDCAHCHAVDTWETEVITP